MATGKRDHVRPADRPGGGPVAELVDDDEHQGGYAYIDGGSDPDEPIVINTPGVIFSPDAPLIDASYVDDEGRQWKVRVPEGSPSPASMGIPVGPPDLSSLGLPLAVEVRLHNQLYNRGLFTRGDLRRRGNEIFAAVQAAYKVDTQAVTALYR